MKKKIIFIFLSICYHNTIAQEILTSDEIRQEFKKIHQKIKKPNSHLPFFVSQDGESQQIFFCSKSKNINFIGIPLPKEFVKTPKEGTLVSISDDGKFYEPTKSEYDKKVIGVIAEITTKGIKRFYIAFSGRVRIRVSCKMDNKVEVGDLLVSSDASGISMKGIKTEKMMGSIIGKALERYDNVYSDDIIDAMITIQ